MKIAVPLTAALVVIVIAPGLLFHFDVTPKVGILLAAIVPILLFSAPRRFQDVNNLCKSRCGLWLTALLAFEWLWLALASVFSVNPWLSMDGNVWRRLGLLTTAAVLLFSLLSAGWLTREPRRMLPLVRTLVLAGAVISLYGVGQYFGFDPIQPALAYRAGEGPFTIVRPPGTLGHADYFAAWLVPVFFLSLAAGRMETQAETTPWRKLAAYFAAAASISAIILSGTRGALVGVACGALVWSIYLGIRISRLRIAIAAATLTAFAAFVFSPAGAKLRARVHWSAEDRFGGARLLLWRDSLDMGMAHPALGYGADVFGTVFPKYQSIALARAYPDFYHESPHNIILDAFIAGGIPLAAVVLGCAALALYSGHTSARAQHPLAAPLLAAVSGMLIAQQFAVFILPTAMLFYLLLAMLVACRATPPPSKASGPVSGSKILPFALGAVLGVALLVYGIRLIVADRELAYTRQRMASGDVDGAVRAHRLVRLWNPPGAGDELYYSREMFRLARSAPHLGARVRAMQESLEAGRLASTHAEDRQNAWYHLAMLHASQNDQAAVERDLRNAIACAPNWFKPHWALAQLLQMTDRHTEALVEAAAAVDLDGGKNPEVTATLLALRASARR
jgi:putative inorganic carbon (HCO3(-)) transporter